MNNGLKLVLASLHPVNVDVNKIAAKKFSYTEGQKKKDNRGHKAINRNAMVSLYSALNPDDGARKQALMLDCEEFGLSRAMSGMNIDALIPNYISKTITTNNPIYDRLDKDRFMVLGATSSQAIETLASFPEDIRPKFSFVWLDTCNVYQTNQECEIYNLFQHNMLSRTGPTVFGATYCKKHDTKGPLIQDRRESEGEMDQYVSLFSRVTEIATKFCYLILNEAHYDNNGMVTVVFVIVPKGLDNLCQIQNATNMALGYNKLCHVARPAPIKEMTAKAFQALVKKSRKRSEREAATERADSKKHARTVAHSDEFVVQKIVDHKDKRMQRMYRVRWHGYSPSDDTWEPEHELRRNAGQVVAEYLAKITGKKE